MQVFDGDLRKKRFDEMVEYSNSKSCSWQFKQADLLLQRFEKCLCMCSLRFIKKFVMFNLLEINKLEIIICASLFGHKFKLAFDKKLVNNGSACVNCKYDSQRLETVFAMDSPSGDLDLDNVSVFWEDIVGFAMDFCCEQLGVPTYVELSYAY